MLRVPKTEKLYIGGKFVRSESGRVTPVTFNKSKEHYSNICAASKKDLRGAVDAAKIGSSAWSKTSAFNRSQVIFRMAEMLQSKMPEFIQVLKDVHGWNEAKSQKDLEAAVDQIFFYAGMADKYQQLMGAVNPVSGPYHNFTTTEPVGLVTLVTDDKLSLVNLFAEISSVMCGGNSLIVLLGKEAQPLLSTIAEVIHTSDVPAGTVNLLSADLDEVKSSLATHMEIRSIGFQNDRKEVFSELQLKGIDNMKRMLPKKNRMDSLEAVLDFVEYKTAWHPIGY